MIKLIKNELMKLIYKKSTIVIVVLFILVNVLTTVNFVDPLAPIELTNERKIEMLNEEMTSYNNSIDNRIRQIDYKLSAYEVSDKEREVFENEKTSLNNLMKIINEDIVKIENYNIDNVYKAIALFKYKMNNKILEVLKERSYLSNKVFIADTSVEISNIISENVKLLNIIDSNVKEADYYPNKSINLMFTISKTLMGSQMMLLIIILIFNILIDEYDKGTIKLSLVQPVNRGEYFVAKFLSALLFTAVLILGTRFVIIIVLTIIYGLGDIFMPVNALNHYVNDMNGNIIIDINRNVFISKGLFLVLTTLVDLLFISIIIAFILLLSVIFKKSLVGAIITLVVVFMAFMVGGMTFGVNDYVKYFFLSFNNSPSIVLGQMGRSMNNVFFTFSGCIVYMLLWLTSFLTIGCTIFKKQDIK